MLRAIDGFAQSNDRAAPSMDPLIAHLSIDRAIIDRSLLENPSQHEAIVVNEATGFKSVMP